MAGSNIAKRKCYFSNELEKEFPFIKRSRQDNLQTDEVVCTVCNSQFSIASGGRRDINKHINTQKHCKAKQASAVSKTVDTFFKCKEAKADDLLCAAKEATFAYHSVQHDLSFNSSACQSKLLSKLYDPKFSSAKTKTEAIVVNVIAPFVNEKVTSELVKSHFVTITIDSSNRLDNKLVPVMVRYFIPSVGIKTKLLEFDDVSGETSDILTEHVIKTLQSNNLLEKVICYCADNTNTNFGGVNRKGKVNVFTKLQGKLDRKLLGIGCGAHIVHNCVQHGVDQLPIDVEVIVVKIFKFFYIYTVRVARLQEFCEFVGVTYKKVMSHSSTRFLSLLPAIERILMIYEGLKSYFLSDSASSCPQIIKEFFNNPANEAYMWFVHGALQIFQGTILQMEKNEISATEVSLKYSELKAKLEARRKNKFIPQMAKKKLAVCTKNGVINSDEFESQIDKFYIKCIEYLDLWSNSFEGADNFPWIINACNYELEWSQVEKSAEYINSVVTEKPATATFINIDMLFDEVVQVNQALKKIKETLDSKKKMMIDEGKEPDIDLKSAPLWVEVFQLLKLAENKCENFERVLEFALSLPGTSAPVERVFSLMKNVWTPDRNRLSVEKVKAILSIKVNSDMSCTEFFEAIKDNSSLLKKVISSEKYDWFQPSANTSTSDA